MPNLKNRRLIKRPTCQLEANGQPVTTEAAGERKRGETCQVEQWRVNRKVFGHQIQAGRLRPDRCGHNPGSGEHEQVNGLQLLQQLGTDLLSDSLTL